jgi:hypothetical protein
MPNLIIVSFLLCGFAALSVMQAHGQAVGQWMSTTNYPTNIYSQSCVLYSGYLYCVGGDTGPASNSPSHTGNSAYYAPLSSSGIGAWIRTTSYPVSVKEHACVTDLGFIYCVGDFLGSSYGDAAYYAPLSFDGIGAWRATTNFPTWVGDQSCVAYSDFIYCIGGFFGSTSPLTGSTVWNSYGSSLTYYAPLSLSGIGTWKQTTNYPNGIDDQSCVVYSGFIYCVGGQSSSAGSTYFASASSSSIGTWTPTTPYPTDIWRHSCVVNSGFIYCLGGWTVGTTTIAGSVTYTGITGTGPHVVPSSAMTSAVYFAPVSSSGIGAWAATTGYPTDIATQACVTDSAFIYCVGGATHSNGYYAVSNSYFAAITNLETRNSSMFTGTTPTVAPTIATAKQIASSSLTTPVSRLSTSSFDTSWVAGLILIVATAVIVYLAVLRPRALRVRKGATIGERVKFCVECGTELPADAKFCDSCGAKQT